MLVCVCVCLSLQEASGVARFSLSLADFTDQDVSARRS